MYFIIILVHSVLTYNNNTGTLVSLQVYDTSLDIASANGHEAVVEVLLKAGANYSSIPNRVSMVQCIHHYWVEFVLSLCRINTSTLVSLQDGNTPLHKASANGHEAVVELLLKAGADPSIRNSVSKEKFVPCIVRIDLYINFSNV